MLEIHKSIRQTLLKISRLSSYLRSSLEEDEDFKEAVVDIYVVLVKFWVEAIKLIQETRESSLSLPSIEASIQQPSVLYLPVLRSVTQN